MSGAERSGPGEEYERVLRSLTAFGATQKELARAFAAAHGCTRPTPTP